MKLKFTKMSAYAPGASNARIRREMLQRVVDIFEDKEMNSVDLKIQMLQPSLLLL